MVLGCVLLAIIFGDAILFGILFLVYLTEERKGVEKSEHG